ncbi:hypothetical protein N7461_008592 [Penicillium sp. DV-2018c]|nr:hypothetical protein N7461_008592 [Penicillium sp. DV-2018c]
MSMSMGDMPAGSMDMGDGVPSLFTLQKMYWAVVGSAIGAATLVNVLDRIIARQRLRDSSLTPAKPKSIFFGAYATLTATAREISYATLRPLRVGAFTLHFPPLGPVLIILANLLTVIVLCFYKLNTLDPWNWENVGYRTGFIAICQLPLIFLLAGRQNIIGFLAGVSYVELNWYHRWVARTLWLTTTIHMAFWLRNWARWNYITYQLYNDPLTKRGFAAWIILTFIVITSFAPIRRLSYEFFVIQHLVTFVGFIVAVWMHAPDEVKAWVWIPIGLVIFDRVARYAWGAYANLAIFHRNVERKGLFAHEATFTALPGNVTRVTIDNPGVGWRPGQHVFLTCHSVVPLQCHPFTIASIPEDNKIELFIRAENGGTRRFFKYASKSDSVLGDGQAVSRQTVFIEGPYGSIRSLRQFDSAVLLAGGMGATFIIPLMRDVVLAWKMESDGRSQRTATGTARLAATKRLRFVWVIKSRSQLAYFEDQLQRLLADVEECRRTRPDFDKEIEVSIYITCDDKLDPPTATLLPHQTEDTSNLNDSTQSASQDVSEKGKIPPYTVTVESTSPPGPVLTGQGCLPGGGCCCTTQIEDEDEEVSTKCTCNCSGPTALPSEKVESGVKLTRNQPSTAGSLIASHTLTGRPMPRVIIQKVLEKAEGESAVVVCGPRGLADDVRRSVVSLSDERAVHKGTGAQGIYLHVENFGL